MLGDDPPGYFLLDTFRNTGADVGGIRCVSSPTPTAEIILRRDAPDERTILIDRSTQTALFSFTQIDIQLMAQADVVVAGGTLDRSGPDTVLTDVIRLARACGKRLFLNPTRIHDVKAIDLHGVTLIQVSRDDFRHYGFDPDAPAAAVAEALLERGADNVVITDGPNGSFGFNHGEQVRMYALPVPAERTRFPTGVGDASFLAAGAGFLSGASMYDYLNVAAVAGAFFIEHGRPATQSEIAQLDSACRPEARLPSAICLSGPLSTAGSTMSNGK
jgi:sugar/nucleoside kinase (ribokinase family)